MDIIIPPFKVTVSTRPMFTDFRSVAYTDERLYHTRLAWADHIAKHIGIHFQSFPHSADIPKE